MLNAAGEPVSFAFPFARDASTGKVACDVQGTLEHVTSQVGVVVSYPGPTIDPDGTYRPGYRPEKPSFGIPWPYGDPSPVDGAAIQTAVTQQVPGAHLAWTEYAALTPTSRVLELDVEG
jgi:hypothetical protein